MVSFSKNILHILIAKRTMNKPIKGSTLLQFIDDKKKNLMFLICRCTVWLDFII